MASLRSRHGASMPWRRTGLPSKSPEGPALVRWLDWAPRNVDPVGLDLVDTPGAKPSTWWVLFGVTPPSAILECLDLATGETVENWAECSPPAEDNPAVPAWRREAWHKKQIRQAAMRNIGSRAQVNAALSAGRRP